MPEVVELGHTGISVAPDNAKGRLLGGEMDGALHIPF